VTLEYLVEEIVGEVQDEHDPGDERWRREGDGCWVLSGLLRPHEVERVTEIRLPEEDDYETVAGLLADRLARMPGPGDAVELRARGRDEAECDVRLTALAMDGLRVDRIGLELLEGDER